MLILRFFLVTLFVTGSVSLSAANDSLHVSVMSFNIRYGSAKDGANHWRLRKELVDKVIKTHDADVIGMQEALKFQIDAILDAAPVYAMVGVGRDDGDTLGEYSAILYKKGRFNVTNSGTFWFSDTPEKIASKSWGNNITRICTWALFEDKNSGASFYHFNLHLDHRSQPSREKSVQLLAKKIAARSTKSPFLVTGDLNAGEDNPAIQFLTHTPQTQSLPELPLIDAFRILHPEATNVGTFNGFKGVRTGNKIDYIFVCKQAKVMHASIIRDNQDGRFPSDHFPVSADIIF